MKCPHCSVEFHVTWRVIPLEYDTNGYWHVATARCSACKLIVIRLGSLQQATQTEVTGDRPFVATFALVRPRASARALLSPDVPPNLAEEYRQACLVLADSPMASGALSRRCLQNLLREHAGVKPGNLDKEIQQVLDSGQLPPYLAEAIDAVRVVGNFSTHPIKSTNSGEIIDVEPGESEWLLDTLESLFDFYFVLPVTLKKKRDALDAKLAAAGKPPLK